LKPRCQIVGWVTAEWLTTEANDQSSLHCVVVLTGDMSDHSGSQDTSRGGGCSKTSACMGQFGCVSMISSMLLVAVLKHREGGAILVSTGSRQTCVQSRQYCQCIMDIDIYPCPVTEIEMAVNGNK